LTVRPFFLAVRPVQAGIFQFFNESCDAGVPHRDQEKHEYSFGHQAKTALVGAALRWKPMVAYEPRPDWY